MIASSTLQSGFCDACGAFTNRGLLAVSTDLGGERQYCMDCLDDLSEAIALLDSPECGVAVPKTSHLPFDADDWPIPSRPHSEEAAELVKALVWADRREAAHLATL